MTSTAAFMHPAGCAPVSREQSQVLWSLLSDGRAHPVATLARRCGVTPPSLRAYLAGLAKAGMPFSTLSDRVQLSQSFVALDADTVSRALQAAHVPCTVQIDTLIDSTNSAVLRELRSGARDALPVAGAPLHLRAAEFQSAGRGRHGRSWHAPPGAALTVSYARRFECGVAALNGLSLVCGLAVRSALMAFGAITQLKWPNDILYHHRKIAGVLVEVQGISSTATMAVIGIGINVAPDPQLLHRLDPGALPPIDLGSATGMATPGAPMDRNTLLVALTIELASHLRQFEKSGLIPFVAAWNAAHAWRDLPVQLLEPGCAPQPVYARDINEQGHLRLDTAAGPRWIFSGDLSIRPAP